MWQAIGEEMQRCRTTVPGAFGRPPRNVHRIFNSFKPAKWSSFILLYSLPVFIGRLPTRYLENLKHLIRIWSILCQREITKVEIEQLRMLCQRYIQDFKRLYFRARRDRLKIPISNLHSILHMADALTHFGPGYGCWCFSGERFNGMIEGKAKSKV